MPDSSSTCVMHPFSYTSPQFSIETSKGKPMYAIGESVSFGRYMTENLSWEKWSSFNNNRNRYVEEAEKYSKPGSVAQKKAYFEAHFKRMAALKAAALLEQANSAETIQGQESVCNDDVQSEANDLERKIVEKESENDELIEAHELERKRVEKESESDDNTGFVVHQNELFSDEDGNNDKQVNTIMQYESWERNELNPVDVNDENSYLNNEESSGLNRMDKAPMQQNTTFEEEVSAAIVKRNPPLSSYMSSINGIGKSPLLASSPAKSLAAVYPGKENYATPMKQKPSINDPDKKRTPLRASINREFNKILSPVIRKIGSSSKASTPLKTPAKENLRDVPEAPSMTPNLAKKGVRSHLDSSACDNKVPRPRWNILSTEGFKSPNIGRNKISSPIIPTSFCLNGERAARRKQKLEEKFNATTMEKAPQASKLKEKAEAELNKFRQTFCFKAMSTLDHYGEHETSKGPKHKGEATQCASPRQSRQLHSSTSEVRSFLPPRRPAAKEFKSRMHL